MGRGGRGGRGGNRGNRGGWNDQNGRNDHPRNNQKQGQRNGRQQRNDSKHEKNHGKKDDKKENKEKQPKGDPCGTCWTYGHPTERCAATLVAEEDRCGCTNPYHLPIKCPWAKKVENVPTGLTMQLNKVLICTWCKETGTTHTVNNCPFKKKFDDGAKDKIHAAYDKFTFCAHCGSNQHLTKGCPVPQRLYKEKDWEAKIWKWEASWEAKNILKEPNLRRPDIDEYMWCHFCEDFYKKDKDHQPNYKTCPDSDGKTAFIDNVPVSLRDVILKEPVQTMSFGPRGIEKSNNWTSTALFGNQQNNGTTHPWVANQQIKIDGDKLTVPCQQCKKAILEFDTNFVLEQRQCRNCFTVNDHPKNTNGKKSQNPGDPWSWLKKDADPQPGTYKFEFLVGDAIAKKEDDRMRRPSDQLEVLPHELWPEGQPQYVDSNVGMLDTFNFPGNSQTYFPSRKHRVGPTDWWVASNAEAEINIYARDGMVIGCQTCGCIMTMMDGDKDNDVVMTCTGLANVFGCAWGYPKWNSIAQNDCGCVAIAGQRKSWVKISVV
ncbi:hypothetical protein BU16DRAFT_588683 [Lophium mytilinum]|uniref:Uncharacterized protein n=1 Tax=Lophium mytilinum TaxID=390894 RepID=A0A6A6RI37_9PEZI|nr:hypothetical protein BU16DRAFT_588683 [Lophium mytilinum]